MKNLELLKCEVCGAPLTWGNDKIVKCSYCRSEYVKNGEDVTITKRNHNNITVSDINLDEPYVYVTCGGTTMKCYIANCATEFEPELLEYTTLDDVYSRTVIGGSMPKINLELIGVETINEK